MFTTGIVLQVPFSEAACKIETTQDTGHLDPKGTLHDTFALFRNALENSNTGECWGDMSGVLYWCVLVMGGAARRRVTNAGWSDDDESIRKYLAASALRLTVLLCFEHPEPTTVTLNRVSKVQELLAREPKRTSRPSTEVVG